MRTSSNDGVVVGREPAKEFADWTGALPRVRRRNLGGIVVATVSGCALILVAAAITRVSHASGAAHAAPAPAMPASLAEGAGASASIPGGESAPAATVEPAAEPAPTTGTLRLERPAWLARASVDGKKLTSVTETIACGKHIFRVAGWRAHPIDVPCGGELVLQH